MNDWVEYLRLVDAGVRPTVAATLLREQKQRRTSNGRHPAPREHGSERGWRQHRTDGTEACGPCRAAHSRHNLRRTAA